VCVCMLAIEFSQVPHEKGLCKVKSESEKETDKRAHTHLITHTHLYTYVCNFDSV